jgi:hypothetical protein
MATRSRKRGVSISFSSSAMKSMAAGIGLIGVIALVFVYGCEQRAGVRPSESAPAAAAQPAKATPAGPAALTDAVCGNCHPVQPQTIAAKGGKHKTEVGCQDCHVEHPPLGANAIPACSMCHSGEPHFELEGCSSCHTDAHAPLDIKFEGNVTGACLTCHPQQGQEVQAHPSAHTDLACNDCHSAHKLIPNCMECHEKHTQDMDFAACKTCHPVHMPTVVTYPDDIPSHYCGACHEQAASLLQANKSKHHELSCAYCHKHEHKNIPPCQTCHGVPHPARMMQQFPACGDCHGIAHDLR